MAIKLLLIASALCALIWLIRSQNTAHRLLVTRITGFTVAAAWIVAVIHPDLLTRIGNAVGVGRGTDMLLYVLVVVFTFTTVGWYQRVRRLDEHVTELTRALALALLDRGHDPVAIATQAGLHPDVNDETPAH